MKRRLLSASVLILLLAASAGAQSVAPPPGPRPDFSGKWVLDAAKSEFGSYPPPEFLINVIEHKEPKVKITTSQKNTQGELTTERNLTTDGKDNPNKLPTMSGVLQDVTSTSRWDGGKLATAMKFDVQGTSIELNDTWELSDSGKVLTIVRVARTPQGDFTVKTVFNKQ